MSTTTPASLSPARARTRRAIRLLFAVIGSLLLFGMVWGGYRGGRAYWLSQYESACRMARSDQNWEELERLAGAWTRWQPERALPWLLAAEAAEKQGDRARAAEFLEALPDEDPTTPAGLLELVNMYFGPLNKPLAGAGICERILRHDRSIGEAHRRLIFFYAMTLQRNKMVIQAREAVEEGCDIPDTYVHLIGADWINFSNAYECNSKWLRDDPENEMLLVARAIHFAGSQSLDESVGGPEAEAATTKATAEEKLLAQLLTRFPKNLELLSYFLKRACQTGNLARVAELLAQAPPPAIEDNRFWRFKGWLHAAQQEFEKAESAYRQALKRNPYDWRSQHELADVLRRLHRYDEVEVLAARATTGKQLAKEILQLPNVQSIPTPTMQRMADYARDCGDNAIADRLSYRIATMRQGKPS